MKEFSDRAKVSSEYDMVLSRIQHDMKRTSRQANVTTSRFKHIQARIQEFLVEVDDMDDEKIGRVWGPR
jgi:hypothetical protein